MPVLLRKLRTLGSLPGYHLKPGFLGLASTAAERLQEKLTRLYEQGADKVRIGEFVRHWSIAVRGGGALFQTINVGCVAVTEVRLRNFSCFSSR